MFCSQSSDATRRSQRRSRPAPAMGLSPHRHQCQLNCRRPESADNFLSRVFVQSSAQMQLLKVSNGSKKLHLPRQLDQQTICTRKETEENATFRGFERLQKATRSPMIRLALITHGKRDRRKCNFLRFRKVIKSCICSGNSLNPHFS